MALTGKTKVLGSETRVSATSSPTNAWTGMESNGGFRLETPSSNRLNNGAAVKSKILSYMTTCSLVGFVSTNSFIGRMPASPPECVVIKVFVRRGILFLDLLLL